MKRRLLPNLLPNLLPRLRADRRGAVLAEFVLVVPLWTMLIFGTIELAEMLWGYAGLQNGVAEGARLATLYPRKSDGDIVAQIRGKAFGINTADLSTPALTAGKSGSIDYVDISVTYTARFPLWNVPITTFTETRRAYRP